MSFLFDIETMGIESTSVVLSAAIINFDLDEVLPDELLNEKKMTEIYHDFFNRACFVKFDTKSQVLDGRLVTKSIVDWWAKQADIPRKLSVPPRATDLDPARGMDVLKKYIDENGGNQQMFFARGSLDQMAIDSLAMSVGEKPLAMYNQWRDVRTAVDLLAESGYGNGYCRVKHFNPEAHVIKHDPRHDCAYDIMMLLYHE